MTRKHKRSLLLSMVLGDGCLHTLRQYGAFTIDHGLQQTDYITWKAQLVSQMFGKVVNVRQGHRGKSVQFQARDNRFKAWRKFCYPNGKKSLTKILPFIKHPEFAAMIWLMDDGYVEPSISKLKDGSKVNYGARFRIFTESQPIEDHEFFIKWFQDNLGVTPKIHMYRCSKRNESFPFLKLNQADSLKLWERIREKVLQFKSMQYKFRYIEEIYQKRILQRVPVSDDLTTEDIVRHS